MKYLQNKIKLDEIRNLIPLLINIYLLAFGFGWVIIHIFFRFFIQRPSYNLNEIKDILSFKHYCFFIFFIFFHILLIIFSCVTLYKRHKSIKENRFVVKILLVFNNILNILYYRPLEYLHDLMAPHIPGSAKFFLYLQSIWKTKGFTYLLILMFDILPKLIIPIIFFIEILVFNSIKLFIYSLSLYIIPVLFQVFLKLFSSFATRNLPFFLEAYDYIKGVNPITNEKGEHLGYTHYNVIVKKEYLNIIDTEDDIKNMIKLEYIENLVIFTKNCMNISSPYVTIFASTIYVIGGISRVLILIF